MSRLAQASMEVLTTYGWMLLVIASIGGALAYFGVFDSSKNLPPQCSLGFDFSCERFNVRTNGIVNVEVGNKAGIPVTITSLTCTYPDGGTTNAALGPGLPLAPGAEDDITCPAGAYQVEDGDYVQVKLTMIYIKQGSTIPHPVEGNVGIKASPP